MRSTLAFMLVMAFATGCSPRKSFVAKYGVAHNEERKRRGIPIIKPSWTIQDMGTYFDCFDRIVIQTNPHRLSKRIFIGTNGAIVREVDSYYSGKKFVSKPPEQTLLSEEIILRYDYSPEKAKSPWTIDASLSAERFSESLTIAEADRLLATWGLSRQEAGP